MITDEETMVPQGERRADEQCSIDEQCSNIAARLLIPTDSVLEKALPPGPEVTPTLWGRVKSCLNLKHWLNTILHLDDSPHSIALGTAIGVFVGITPTGGFQMALVLLIAFCTKKFFRFNRIAGLIGVYISNPLTTIPLCWYSYRIGTLFYPNKTTWLEFKEMFHFASISDSCSSLKLIIVNVGLPLAVGSVILGAIFAIVSYPVVLYLASSIQKRRKENVQFSKPLSDAIASS
ncbi:DUF2062 domain-containing protein [Planctomicrobium sp. SH668]|uniref:DUF2062 domain-containing protein n=1 Tax=Planctomicrobium sp. SH668 TaxID=3448126 RepID=UPI003F5C4DC6